MGDDAATEERARALPRPVDELVGHDDVPRRDVFSETTHGTHRDDPLRPEPLHAVHVGAEVELGRQEMVTTSVPRQEDEPRARETPDDEVVRRRPEGRLDRDALDRREAGKLVEPAAAEDAEGRFRHARRDRRGRAIVGKNLSSATLSRG